MNSNHDVARRFLVRLGMAVPKTRDGAPVYVAVDGDTITLSRDVTAATCAKVRPDGVLVVWSAAHA